MDKVADSYTMKVAKDTDTVYRLKIHYVHKGFNGLLKLEVSFRSAYKESDVTMLGGVRMYKLSRLIDQKASALEGRTKARDLYDVAFLARIHQAAFSKAARQRLEVVATAINALEHRFLPAFEDDEILSAEDLPGLVLQITDAATRFRRGTVSAPICEQDHCCDGNACMTAGFIWQKAGVSVSGRGAC